jgi:hypothetical protein
MLMSVEIKVERKELFDWRKKKWVDELLPTLSVARANKVRGTGTTVTAGSHRVGPGSSFLMTYLSIQSGSPGLWWSLTREGTPYPGEQRGTVDVGYFESKGVETRLGDVKSPVHVLGGGSFRIRLITPGSAKDFGVAFEGIEL